MAGAVRVELTSTVLETAILTVVLRPYLPYFNINALSRLDFRQNPML